MVRCGGGARATRCSEPRLEGIRWSVGTMIGRRRRGMRKKEEKRWHAAVGWRG